MFLLDQIRDELIVRRVSSSEFVTPRAGRSVIPGTLEAAMYVYFCLIDIMARVHCMVKPPGMVCRTYDWNGMYRYRVPLLCWFESSAWLHCGIVGINREQPPSRSSYQMIYNASVVAEMTKLQRQVRVGTMEGLGQGFMLRSPSSWYFNGPCPSGEASDCKGFLAAVRLASTSRSLRACGFFVQGTSTNACSLAR